MYYYINSINILSIYHNVVSLIQISLKSIWIVMVNECWRLKNKLAKTIQM